jgi:host factor-I protein
MADGRSQSLQDTFLMHLKEHNVPVTMFLMNGIKLQGYVTHFDRFGVWLTRDRQTQLVYKQAISTISPLTAVQLSTTPDEGPT